MSNEAAQLWDWGRFPQEKQQLLKKQKPHLKKVIKQVGHISLLFQFIMALNINVIYITLNEESPLTKLYQVEFVFGHLTCLQRFY